MSENGLVVASEVFGDVVRDAKVIQVDPSCCIPFIKVRDVVSSGVRVMKHSLSRNEDEGMASGAVAGGFLPTVVDMSGSLQHYVITYFMREFGEQENQAKVRYDSRPKWYGVVDGTHRLLALLALQEENPSRWCGFRWCVMLLNGGQKVSVLRAFARAQNVRQSHSNYVETTCFDLLKGLKEESKRLFAELGGRTPTGKELAERYCASHDRTTSTIRQLSYVALRLSDSVIDEIGRITNFECSKLACAYYSAKGRNDFTPETVLNLADCRIYRHFLSTSSLKQATLFMQAKGDHADQIRINTLYRIREVCRLTGFRPLSYRIVNEQFNRASSALKEARKFECLLMSQSWPIGMDKIRENLLRNSVLDDEVEDNDGNDSKILPSLLIQLRRCCPQQAPFMETKYQASLLEGSGDKARSLGLHANNAAQELVPPQASVQMNVPGKNNLRTGKGDIIQDPHAIADDGLGGGKQEGNRAKNKSQHMRDQEVLEQLGVRCFHMKWQEYHRNMPNSTEALFDLVITEPPLGISTSRAGRSINREHAMSEREMSDFVEFCRRVVLPGGYVVLFCPARFFRDWVRLFRGHEFASVDYPFVVARDTCGLQRNNQLLFPQKVCDLAVMAVCPGKHPRGFKANFDALYNLVGCSYKRKFAFIDKVPTVKKLRMSNSRAFVRAEEKNSDMIAEMMVTFSPEGGRVLDPYAGTMTTAIASMQTSRACVVIENDPECYSLAFSRLCYISRLYSGTPNQVLDARSRLEKLQGSDRENDIGNNEQTQSESNGLESSSRAASNCSTEGKICAEGRERKSSQAANGGKSYGSVDLLKVGNDENCGNHSKREMEGRKDLQSPELSDNNARESRNRETQDKNQGLSENDLILEKDKVNLLLDGAVIGTATVQMEAGEGERGYRTKLHGSPLSLFAKDDEDLVVIWKAKIREEYFHHSYPYDYGGVEGPVSTLGEMESGFHAWDLHAMTEECA